MKKLFLAIFLITLVFSCRRTEEQSVDENNYFIEPQPINNSELSKIPARFQGKFMSNDSIYINIAKNGIIQEYDYKFKISKTALDSLKGEFEITDKKIITKEVGKAYNYRFLKDSVELSEKRIDTIFMFSDHQKAKRIDNKLILNFKDSLFWNIRTISIQNDNLTMSQISDFADLKQLDSITVIKSKMIDSTRILLNPSRREFKKIINIQNAGFKVNYRKL